MKKLDHNIWANQVDSIVVNVSSGWVHDYYYSSKQVSDPVTNKIDSFARLQTGWDYGRGGPIASDIRQKAKDWADILSKLGLSYANAFPGVDSITVSGTLRDHRIEIAIRKEGNLFVFGFAHDLKKKQVFYRPRLKEQEMVHALVEALGSMNILGAVWSAFTSSTRENMIPNPGSSFATPFAGMGIPYHSSAQNVPQRPLGQSAITSKDISASGRAPQATQQFFGVSTPTYSLAEVA